MVLRKPGEGVEEHLLARIQELRAENEQLYQSLSLYEREIETLRKVIKSAPQWVDAETTADGTTTLR
jgi:hypothetical protein